MTSLPGAGPRPAHSCCRTLGRTASWGARCNDDNDDDDDNNDDDDDDDDMLPVVVWLDGGEGLVGGVRLYGPARRALAAQHGGVVILHRLNKMLFLIHIFLPNY